MEMEKQQRGQMQAETSYYKGAVGHWAKKSPCPLLAPGSSKDLNIWFLCGPPWSPLRKAEEAMATLFYKPQGQTPQGHTSELPW